VIAASFALDVGAQRHPASVGRHPLLRNDEGWQVFYCAQQLVDEVVLGRGGVGISGSSISASSISSPRLHDEGVAWDESGRVRNEGKRM